MIYSILALIHHCYASIQADHPWTQTPSAESHEDQLSSMHLVTLAQPVAPIIVEEMWRMWWKRETIGTLKETRCHSWKIVFKEMIQLGSIHPPFWFSMLKSKMAMLILLEGKYSRSLL